MIGRKLGGKVGSAVEAVRAYADKPGQVALALLISMVANGLSIIIIYKLAEGPEGSVRA